MQMGVGEAGVRGMASRIREDASGEEAAMRLPTSGDIRNPVAAARKAPPAALADARAAAAVEESPSAPLAAMPSASTGELENSAAATAATAAPEHADLIRSLDIEPRRGLRAKDRGDLKRFCWENWSNRPFETLTSL